MGCNLLLSKRGNPGFSMYIKLACINMQEINDPARCENVVGMFQERMRELYVLVVTETNLKGKRDFKLGKVG